MPSFLAQSRMLARICFVGSADGFAAGVREDVEDDGVAVGLGDAEAGGEGGGVLEELAGGFVCVEGGGDGGAAAGLEGVHLGALASLLDPAELLHLFEGLPHADEAYAAAGGVEDGVGVGPAELLDELVAHGLFAFDAEGLLERGDVEPDLVGGGVGFLLGLDAVRRPCGRSRR